MTTTPFHPQSVCVVGLGYIGLPLASLAATRGLSVLGVDIKPEVIKTLQSGKIHIVEPDLHALVSAAAGSGFLRVSTTPEPSDYFILCVPTPFRENHQADLSYVEAAAASLIPHLRAGSTVILESTCPPGTTRNVLAPILEKSGLQLGNDLFVAYCPERVLPGQILRELVDNDRVIGGVDAASTKRAANFYRTFVNGDLHESDSDTAEMVKLVENAYRDVNIAFANELSLIADHLGLNIWKIIELANKHPRVKVLAPGPGVGGHCIAVDPWFIVEKAPTQARLIRTARQINDSMPGLMVSKIERTIKDQADPKIACFGLTYKANIDDLRESPALDVVMKLIAKGYDVKCHDPYVTKHLNLPLASVEECLEGAHCAAILVDHKLFKYLNWDLLARRMAQPVFVDTRGVIPLRRINQIPQVLVVN